MNLYRYCAGNPINHSDPTGLLDHPIADIVWRMACHMDSGNSLQGTLQEIQDRQAGMNNGGTGEDHNGSRAKSLSGKDEGNKLRTPKENFKIADDWLKKHYKELDLPDPRENRPKLVRLPGPKAGDWNPFRGIRLDPYKNKSPASFVDSYSEELLHAKAGFIHYLRDVFQGDQSPHHSSTGVRTRPSESLFKIWSPSIVFVIAPLL